MNPRQLYHIDDRTMQTTTMIDFVDFERGVSQETNDARQLSNAQMFVLYFVVIWRVSAFKYIYIYTHTHRGERDWGRLKEKRTDWDGWNRTLNNASIKGILPSGVSNIYYLVTLWVSLYLMKAVICSSACSSTIKLANCFTRWHCFGACTGPWQETLT